MRKLFLPVVLLSIMLSFQSCTKTTSGGNNSEMKAGIYPACNSTINFDSKGSHVDFVLYPDGLNFSATATIPGSTDPSNELGMNIYIGGGQTLHTGMFDLNSVWPLSFVLYWDPKDDALDEFGHISGQITINSFNFESGHDNDYNYLTEMDFSFNGILQDPNGNEVCISDGHCHWEK